MLQTNLTHYWPWTDADDVAWCGAALDDVRQHSLTPSCAACARRIALEDAEAARFAEADALPFLDDDALKAGVALPQLTHAYVRAGRIGGRR